MITFSPLRAETLLVGLRSHSIFHTEGYQGKKDHDEYSSRYSCFRANCRSHPLGIGVPASTKIPICFVSYHYFVYTAPTASHLTRLGAHAWRWQKIRANLPPVTIIVFYNGLLVGQSGIEPPTCRFSVCHSTIWVTDPYGVPSQIRTAGQSIKSALLYQLS